MSTFNVISTFIPLLVFGSGFVLTGIHKPARRYGLSVHGSFAALALIVLVSFHIVGAA